MGQSLSNILIHGVFSTKNRTPWISYGIRPKLHAYLGGILRNQGCCPLEIGGVEDHVHVLFILARTVTVAARERRRRAVMVFSYSAKGGLAMKNPPSSFVSPEKPRAEIARTFHRPATAGKQESRCEPRDKRCPSRLSRPCAAGWTPTKPAKTPQAPTGCP